MNTKKIDFMSDNYVGFVRTGIGVDMESTDRFEKLHLCNNQSFLQKIFTKKELSYCFSKKYPAQHLAARFAAKEAVVKAMGEFGVKRLAFNVIEVQNNKEGMPKVTLHDKRYRKVLIKISLSHDKTKALAFAVARVK